MVSFIEFDPPLSTEISRHAKYV